MTVRMRTIPTEAERAAHSGKPWLCRDIHGNPRAGYWSANRAPCDPALPAGTDEWNFYVVGSGGMSPQRVAAWTFWPADENLNKIEIEGFRFSDCTPEKPAPPDPTVGHIWSCSRGTENFTEKGK